MVVPVAISISYNNSKSRTNLLFYNYTNSICLTVKLFASSDSNNGLDDSVVLKNITNNKIRTSGYTIANYALEGAGTEELI